MLIDLHCHSNHSDGAGSIPAIEDHCLRLGIGVALTDHNEIRGAMQLYDRQRLPCIPALEVGTREGLEFLVYFSSPAAIEQFYVHGVEPNLLNRFMVRSRVKTLDCLELARELGGFVSLAHPYALGRKSLGKHWSGVAGDSELGRRVVDGIDAYELFNGGIPAFSNRRAEKFLSQLGKHITVGSDAHSLAHIGSSGLVFPAGAQEEPLEQLFKHLSENAQVDQLSGHYTSKIATLHIIAAKHTAFFFRTRRAIRLKHESHEKLQLLR